MVKTLAGLLLLLLLTPAAVSVWAQDGPPVRTARVPRDGALYEIPAEALFQPVPAPPGRASIDGAEPHGAATLRRRSVSIDFGQLTTAVNATWLSTSAAPSGLRLNLFEDASFTGLVEDAAPTFSGGYSLTGRLAAVEMGTVTLVVNGAVVAGTVRTPEATYHIRPAAGGLHAVSQIDPAAALPLEPDTRRLPAIELDEAGDRSPRQSMVTPPTGAGSSAPTGDQATPAEEDGSRIDVLAVYTPAAEQTAGGRAAVRAMIDLAVAETNHALRDSVVIQRVNLVGMEEVNYRFSEQHHDPVFLLRDPSDGHMDEVHAMRDERAADLVALFVTDPFPYGGTGFVLRDTSPEAAEDYAFSVTHIRDPTVLAHELGHNMGLEHDRWDEVHRCCTARDGRTLGESLSPYGYGYVNQRAFEPDAPEQSRWHTIMAIGSQCQNAGFGCARLLRYSNPDLTRDGDRMGVQGDERTSSLTGPADARRTLNETRRVVANFRVAPCRGGRQDSAACDRRALEALYDATGGGWNWTNTANWRTDAPLDRWHGVRTDSTGRVTRLDLAGNGLVGRVPLDITNLSKLMYFDISGTAACIPSEAAVQTWRATVPTVRGLTCIDPLTEDRAALEALFDSTGGANWTNRSNWKTDAPLDQWYGVETRGRRVSTLRLGGYDETTRRHVGNGLAGSLPAEVGNLTDLRWLSIVGNPSLTGPVPAELGNLTNLTYLNLEVNSLTGTIPAELANLKALNRLNLLSNRLTGGIPAELGTLADLVDLWLQHNELTGPIPAALDGLASLRTLNLASNQLTGSIPAVLGNLADLRRLSLGGNPLTGPIPRSLTRLSMLESLDISNTRVCVPDDAGMRAWLATIADFRSSGLACGPRNRPPEAVGTLEDRTLTRGGAALVVDVARAFADPDGDPLTYTAVSSSPGVAAVALAGSRLTVTPVSPGSATVTVTATDPAGASAMQRFGVTVAARATFTDHPITPGATPIRAVHFMELRERIEALRVRSRLPAFRWTDPTLVPGTTPVKRVHLTELRSALDAVYDAADRARPAYTDADVAAGAISIKAAHVMELRTAVLAVE